MKVFVTMTKKEKNNILSQILFDPCERVDCSGVDCARCPLREAIDNLDNVIDCIPIEGE